MIINRFFLMLLFSGLRWTNMNIIAIRDFLVTFYKTLSGCGRAEEAVLSEHSPFCITCSCNFNLFGSCLYTLGPKK